MRMWISGIHGSYSLFQYEGAHTQLSINQLITIDVMIQVLQYIILVGHY